MHKFTRLALVAGIAVAAVSMSTAALATPGYTAFNNTGTSLKLIPAGNSTQDFNVGTANGGGYYYTFTTDHAYKLNIQTSGTLDAANVVTPFVLEAGATPGGTVLGTSTGGLFGSGLTIADLAKGTYNVSVASSTVNEAITGNASVAAVPEPAAWSLMMIGIGGVGAVMRRGRKTSLAVA
jgi:hypothetical protein